MKKMLSLFAALLVFALLNGCIISQSPGSGTVSVNVGNTAYFSVRVMPWDTGFIWSLDGAVAEGATARSFSYTPEMADVGSTHTVTVVVSGESATWTVNVLPPIYGDILTETQAQDILYAAYAGIGYNEAGNQTDDAFLFDVMFDNLNSSIAYMVMAAFNSADIDTLIKMTSSGGTAVYVDSAGNRFNLYLKINLFTNTYSGTLSVDFSDTGGYNLGYLTFFGDPGKFDLAVSINGSVDIEIDLPAFSINEFGIGNVAIAAKDSLNTNDSSTSINVDYNEWSVAYSVVYGDNPQNTKLVPDMGSIAPPPPYNTNKDNRNYTCKGSFSVNGNIYSFGKNNSRVRYQQTDNGDATMSLAIEGDLDLPGIDIDGLINVKTTDIVRNESGIWISGSMTLSGYDSDNDLHTSYDITFAADESANGEEPLTWTMADWQNALEPIF